MCQLSVGKDQAEWGAENKKMRHVKFELILEVDRDERRRLAGRLKRRQIRCRRKVNAMQAVRARTTTLRHYRGTRTLQITLIQVQVHIADVYERICFVPFQQRRRAGRGCFGRGFFRFLTEFFRVHLIQIGLARACGQTLAVCIRRIQLA